jgi:hypothetical protein
MADDPVEWGGEGLGTLLLGFTLLQNFTVVPVAFSTRADRSSPEIG